MKLIVLCHNNQETFIECSEKKYLNTLQCLDILEFFLDISHENNTLCQQTLGKRREILKRSAVELWNMVLLLSWILLPFIGDYWKNNSI